MACGTAALASFSKGQDVARVICLRAEREASRVAAGAGLVPQSTWKTGSRPGPRRASSLQGITALAVEEVGSPPNAYGHVRTTVFISRHPVLFVIL